MKTKPSTYIIYFLLIGLFCFMTSLKAAPGDLDPTFSDDGRLLDSPGTHGSDYTKESAIQADGKIVVIGWSYQGDIVSCGITRFNVDGTLDTAFDGDGKAVTFANPDFYCRAVVIQPDGKIVVAGSSLSFFIEPFVNYGHSDFTLFRYNSDGSPDTTFDGDGKVTTNFINPFTNISSGDEAYSLAIQPDGKILAAGSTNGLYGRIGALARYNPDGSLDTTFSDDGRVTTDAFGWDDGANSVAIQSDGKIVAAGTNMPEYYDPTFGIIRFNSDGSTDMSFGNKGKVLTNLSEREDLTRSLVIQPDGKIVLTGFSSNGMYSDFVILRYLPNGSLDTMFDDDGIIVTGYAGHRATTQPDGKIIAVGGDSQGFLIARYDNDGSLDQTFNGNGIVESNLLSGCRTTAIQPDGKIIGVCTKSENTRFSDFALIRYDPDGSLDTNFGNGGKVTTEMSRDDDFANAMALQPDGKIVLIGYSIVNSQCYLVVARYNTDGSLDNSFDNDGKVSTKYFAGKALAIQPNGKIVVTSNRLGNSSPTAYNGIVRYNADGSLDTTFNYNGSVTTAYVKSLNSVIVEPNGKIVAGGFILSNENQNDNFALIRYNPDGSPDSSFQNDYQYVGGIATYDIFSYSADKIESIALDSAGKIVAAGTASNNFALARIIGDAPSAPSVLLSGRVTSPQGQGIGNIKVTITNSNG